MPPDPSAPREATSLFGRDAEQAAVDAELRRAVAGQGGLVLVSGEPGIGKTSILEELAAAARQAAVRVVWGTCWDGDGAPELWPWQRVLSDLGHELDLTADDDPGRFALFTRVARLLAESGPLLVVLDDLQWADPSCLRLLRYGARELRSSAVLVAGGSRTSGLHGPLRELVGDTATRLHVPLSGLDASAVAAMLGEVTGVDADARRVGSIASRSGGNPFFVRQLARLPAVLDGSAALPAAIDEAVAARLAVLPGDTREQLVTAALVGRRFENVLVGTPGALADFQPALTAGLIEHEGPGVYRFVHDLVREHLVERLDADSARRRHHGIVVALAALPDAEMRLSRLAGHATRAVPETSMADAVRWCREAATAASRLHSYDEAARHLDAAAELDEDPSLSLDLADALLRGGHRDQAWRLYEQVTTGEPALMARAAIGLHESGVRVDEDHAQVVRALESVLDILGHNPQPLRARVGAALARELADGPLADQPRAERIAAEALDLARRSGDPPTVAACLFARHDVVWGPGTAADRVALGAELAQVAKEAGDLGLAFHGLLCRYVALVELGEPGASLALAELHRAAEETGQPYLGYLAASRQDGWDVMIGAAGEDRLRDTYALGRRIEVPDAYGVFVTQLVVLDLTRLDFAKIIERHLELGNTVMPPDFHVEELSWELVGRGDLDGARAVIEGATPPMERSLFRWRALAAVAMTAEVAVATGSRQQCAAAYAELAPYTGTVIVIGGGVSIVGPADLYLALCARVLGDPRADEHARTAMALARRFGAVPWIDRLEALTSGEPGGVFRRDGAVWRLEFGGVAAHLPHHKGLADLATLLAYPGEDVAALTLAGGTPQVGSDPVLDDAARAAYRRRLGALQEEMDSTGDVARLDELEAERDVIVGELKAATGLGGRPRRLGDPGERARSTVTARIRDVLRRLDTVHPDLAAHLRDSVHTGRSCSYRPATRVTWLL